MKDSKDFEMSRFVPDSSMTETTIATVDTRQSKRKAPTAKNEPNVPTAPTPSSEQAVKSRQTVSTLPIGQSVPSQRTVSEQPIEPTQSAQSAQPQRTSTRQRKASLEEYRETFMIVPKIIDRQPVFVSRETRDWIDQIVRRLGERKMSVSGFLENLARHHLDLYAADLEQ